MPDRYERAETDSLFRARLERAFRDAGGVGSALDELWWREGRPSSSIGWPEDPERERAILQEAAYAPAPDQGEARARSARLAAFEARRRAQREALDAAILIVDPVTNPKGVRAFEGEPAAGRGSAATPGPARPSIASGRASRTPGRRLLTLAFVATAVAAFALGAGLVGVTVGRSTGALANGSGSSSGQPTQPRETTVLGRALSRAQVPSDRLPERLAAYVHPDSARLLFDEGQTLGGKHWRVWIGTGETSAQLCVVATRDDETSLRNCFRREHAFSDLYSFALYGRNDIGLTVRFDRGAVSITGL